MFGIGMQELLLILVVALIVLGPKRLPEVAKSLGKAMNEFKRAASDIKESLDLDGSSIHPVKKSFDAMNTPPAAADTHASATEDTSATPPSSPAPEETTPKTPQPPHASA
jgi:Tat protein translocase TatB subunit